MKEAYSYQEAMSMNWPRVRQTDDPRERANAGRLDRVGKDG
jgi:hypothetical protein